MKISMPIMAILVTISLVAPYLWFILAGRKDQRKNKKIVESILKKKDLILTQKEQWNTNFIGIDQNKKILLFFNFSENNPTSHHIDLSDVASCRINKTFNSIKKENRVITELKTLDLEFLHISKKESLTLNFFNIDNYFNEDFEQKRAEKWLNLILKNSGKGPLKKAA